MSLRPTRKTENFFLGGGLGERWQGSVTPGPRPHIKLFITT
jgi:hypothetical protein